MQKTAYELSISDWRSDVCSSDLSNAIPTRESSSIRKQTPSRSRASAGSGSSPLSGLLRLRDVHSTSKALSHRSEERRVGKECVSTCSSRWSPYQETTSTAK